MCLSYLRLIEFLGSVSSSNLENSDNLFSFKYFFPHLFSDSYYMNVNFILSHRSLSLCSIFFSVFFFYLCFYLNSFYCHVFTFIILFSPKMSNLLLIIFGILFISDIFVFISRNLNCIFFSLYTPCFYLTCRILPLAS